MMNKMAFYSDFIYYNNEIHNNSYLLVTDNIIDGISNNIESYPDYKIKKFAIAGGVASNTALRAAFEAACEKNGVKFYHPSPVLCTDNAAMIGAAAYYEYRAGVRHGLDLNAVPNLKLGER